MKNEKTRRRGDAETRRLSMAPVTVSPRLRVSSSFILAFLLLEQILERLTSIGRRTG
jgi:hypothetical protein